jgi:hypothetical protein
VVLVVLIPIKLVSSYIRFGGTDCTDVDQNRNERRALVYMVMKLRAS